MNTIFVHAHFSQKNDRWIKTHGTAGSKSTLFNVDFLIQLREKNGFVDGGMCVCPQGLTDKKEVASCEIQITRFQADKDVFPTDEILERNFGTEKDKIISSVLDEALKANVTLT